MNTLKLGILFLLICHFSDAQTLVHRKVNECDRVGFTELKINRVFNKIITEDTLHLDISYIANCCADHAFKYHFQSDTLFLVENRSTSRDSIWRVDGKDSVLEIQELSCTCNCYYKEMLCFIGILDTNFTVVWNERVLVFSKSKYIKFPDDYTFDKYTPINQLDSLGRKIGFWKTKSKHSRKISYLSYYFIDETGNDRILWSKTFENKTQLVSVSIYDQTQDSRMILEPEQYQRMLNDRFQE